jgi:spore maturation protein CgeB
MANSGHGRCFDERIGKRSATAATRSRCGVKFVIFGLTVSSSWGNGHATLWRGLISALARSGHAVAFFERDVPYYADTRDLWRLDDGAELLLYEHWDEVRDRAAREVAGADLALTTSYCPDALAAAELILDRAPAVRAFYDLDTPVTLARLSAGERPFYLPSGGLADFDLVLSYTGGSALDGLRDRLGARRVLPLYGHADPERHRPARPEEAFRADLSYLGTYAADRQRALETLFVEPAHQRPNLGFVIGGSGYPADFPWSPNIRFVRHLPPSDHPAFFSSARITLNVTRGEMAEMGYCPSGRLFEAAACGTPVLSDEWEGLDTFFEPGEEILIASGADDVLAALDAPDAEIARVASAARARVLEEHTSAHRARELVEIVRSFGAGDDAGLGAAGSEPCGA